MEPHDSKSPQGHTRVSGRPTKLQNTTRPDTIWPEERPRLSKKQKKDAVANIDEEETRLQEARRTTRFRSFNAVYSRRSARRTLQPCRFSNAQGCQKLNGYTFQTSWCGGRSQRRGIGTHASARVGSSQVEITGEGMPTNVDKATTQSIEEPSVFPRLFVHRTSQLFLSVYVDDNTAHTHTTHTHTHSHYTQHTHRTPSKSKHVRTRIMVISAHFVESRGDADVQIVRYIALSSWFPPKFPSR